MVNLENKNKSLFASKLLEEFIWEITGANTHRIINKHPEDSVLVGKLSPVNSENEDLSSSTNINRIGMDFFVTKESLVNGKLQIEPQGEFYYRVFPTLEEQRDFMLSRATEIYRRPFKDFSELEVFIEKGKIEFSEEVVQIYKKVPLKELDIEINLSQIYNIEKNIGFKEITYQGDTDSGEQNYLTQTFNAIKDDLDTYNLIREKVKLVYLKNDGTWRNFLSVNSAEAKLPKWSFGVNCEIRPVNETECFKISVSIFNLTEKDAHQKDKIRVNTIFNSGLRTRTINCDLSPIELPYFEDDYKYDKTQSAMGINCTVQYDNSKKELYTTHLPVFHQYRLKTRDDIKVTFEELVDSPLIKLEEISKGMKIELNDWKKYLEKKILAKELTLQGELQLVREIQDFELEISRFENGIRVIKEYSIILEAFKQMNKAFSLTSKKYDRWRLFQIVFIVSLIPDVCTSEYSEEEMGPCYIEKVDLLYFPTGGGKTEAFLGITVFTLFFDRLRDKNAGVTAIIKYPLRLLSVQQVQRLANILAKAEIIRREHVDMKDGEVFSLGYYVGDNNTPNKISQSVAEKFERMSKSEMNEEYLVMDRCPYCGSNEVQVEFIKEKLRLQHRCTVNGCDSGGILPFYMVDREIYRYLPSVIISTIDKFASIGVQSDFRNILGEINYKCDHHGYTSKWNCTEKEICEERNLLKEVNLKDAAPTLFIQDELHLLRESLGVYDAHYESFVQYYIHQLSSSRKKIKIVGATATISAYREQSQHLYLKDPIRFPCASPYIDRNFYAFIDYEEMHRKILGYAPFGKAIINSVVYSMKYLKQILWKYYQNPELIMQIPGVELPNKEEALQVLEDYWILLQYNNVKLDGNKVISALDDPINTELEREGVQPFKPEKMTGDDSFQDVRKILARVETSKDIFNDLNLITATSMISHGVDADRFNLMFFFGMPGNTAEYIQAYSRVGRRNPGVVFMIMRPSRERDQSYLKNFLKFHDFKDILVEPVPINRWATKAIERTFPGILSALILNYYDFHLQNQYGGRSIYMMSMLQQAIAENNIKKSDIERQLKESYQSNNKSIGKLYDEWIEKAVEQFFDRIKYEDFNPKNKKDAYIIEGMERLGFLKPMNSLRDTDIPIIIEMR